MLERQLALLRQRVCPELHGFEDQRDEQAADQHGFEQQKAALADFDSFAQRREARVDLCDGIVDGLALDLAEALLELAPLVRLFGEPGGKVRREGEAGSADSADDHGVVSGNN